MLVRFLDLVVENPYEPREPRELVLNCHWEAHEHQAILLVTIFPSLALCERASHGPPERQEGLLSLGMEAAEFARGLADAWPTKHWSLVYSGSVPAA